MSPATTLEMGSRVSWWLRRRYRTHTAKKVAREFGVSVATAKRWLAGALPTTDHLSAMAGRFGHTFVALIYEPMTGPWPDVDTLVRIQQLRARLAALEKDFADAGQVLPRLAAPALPDGDVAPGAGGAPDGAAGVAAPANVTGWVEVSPIIRDLREQGFVVDEGAAAVERLAQRGVIDLRRVRDMGRRIVGQMGRPEISCEFVQVRPVLRPARAAA